MNQEIKCCIKCKRDLPLDQFQKKMDSASKLKPYCIECVNTYNKEYYQKTKEQKKRYNRQYYLKNKHRFSKKS